MASRILSPYGRMRGDDGPSGNPIYTRQPPASPVHLSASMVLRPGASGSVPPAALKNPMGQDMEILEIKFEIVGPLASSAVQIFGGTVWCEFFMGDVKITNGAIPVWNFGRAEDLPNELQEDDSDLTGSGVYVWRLPRPLFIPAGAALLPKLVHTGFINTALNVRVGYSARTVFRKPKTIQVPWVAKYATKVFNPIETATVDNSSELDLVNSNSEPLHLQRFVGRTLLLRTDGSSSEDSPQYFGSQYLLLRMTDSYGRPIVKSYTPFRSVFGALTRSWEMDNGAVLDPGGYYNVQIKKDTISTGGSDVSATAQAFISMVGWRDLGAP